MASSHSKRKNLVVDSLLAQKQGQQEGVDEGGEEKREGMNENIYREEEEERAMWRTRETIHL